MPVEYKEYLKTPTASISITQNGTEDVVEYATANVNVPDIPAVTQTKSVTYTTNGTNTITKDSGYDGMSSVTVTVSIPTYTGSVS